MFFSSKRKTVLVFLVLAFFLCIFVYLFVKNEGNRTAETFNSFLGLKKESTEEPSQTRFEGVRESYSKYFDMAKEGVNNFGILRGVEGNTLEIEAQGGIDVRVPLDEEVVYTCYTTAPESAAYADIYLDFSKMPKEVYDRIYEEQSYLGSTVADILQGYYVGQRIRFNLFESEGVFKTNYLIVLDVDVCHM